MTNLELGKKYWIKGEVIAYTPRGTVISINNVGEKFWVSDDLDIEPVEVIPEREKVTIPPYVADWVEQCKVRGDLADAINPIDFCTDKKVADWYEEQEFAEEILAKAYLVGYVVEEPLGLLLVEMPAFSYWKYYFLYNDKNGCYDILGLDEPKGFIDRESSIKVTEAEAKEKYPNFKWVSLEELEE